jgi:RND family efflux transporter MFP subunit
MSRADTPRKGFRRLLSRRLLAILPVVAGLVLLVLLVKSRTGSPRRAVAESSQIVRVVPAAVVNVVPRTLGYGRVRPALTWEGVGEVAGRILDTHELFEVGSLVPAGTELVRIDPADYELSIEEITKGTEELEALVDELDAQQANDEALLQIEERSLALVEKDLERQRELLATSVVSQSALDEVERRALAQRTTAQRLRNSLRLIPARKRALLARVASMGARLSAARRDLDRTRIVAPFDLRITAILAQKGGYVAKGAPLARGDATATIEIAAQFQIDKVRRLLPQGKNLPLGTGIDGAQLPQLLQLLALVRLREGDFVVEWEARFARVDASLDPRSNTVGFIVVVAEPYEKARTGTRPVLMRGMFTEVELRGAITRERIVLPRSSLDGDHVWIVDEKNRMRRRRVRTEFAQGEFVVVAEGLDAGDQVIVSDPVPALDGVLVQPQVDDDLLGRIVAEAEGRGSIK